jgi:menaquinone-dependent protoporphyrinogen oxidase
MLPTRGMANLLVAFDTKYGQTEKIAEYMCAIARLRGHSAQAVRVSAIGALDDFDAAIVMSPVFMGKHMDSVREFMRRHHDELAARPSAFFSVSGAAGSRLATERANGLQAAHDFVREMGLRPNVVSAFGGAINYPGLNPIMRFIIKRIAKGKGELVDTSKVQEMTDWRDVERKTLELLDVIAHTKAA